MLQANIVREVKKITEGQESGTEHLVILCVWQRGADALLSQYRELATLLPKADNLEVMVVTKEELMKQFKASVQESESTTLQINTLCANIDSLIKEKTVHLFIDECWVTVPKKFSAHMTPVVIFSSLYSMNMFILRVTLMKLLVIFHL